MGAWIEIAPILSTALPRTCRTLYGCVDWNWVPPIRTKAFLSRTLYGCVDWNLEIIMKEYWSNLSHPLWVRGLKCRYNNPQFSCLLVAPFMGAWIEIVLGLIEHRPHQTVAPFMGAWIEIKGYKTKTGKSFVAPFMGAWIEITCMNSKIIFI